MKLLSYLAFVCCLEGLALAAVAWTLNPRARLNRATAVSGLFSFLWAGTLVFTYAADPATALWFYRLGFIGLLAVNLPMIAVFLELAGVSLRFQRAILWPAGVMAVLFYLAFWATNFPLVSFVPGPWGNVGVPAATPVALVSDTMFVALDLFCVALLVRSFRKTTSRHRRSLIVWFLAGIVLAILLFFVLGFVERAFGLPPLAFLTGGVLTAIEFSIVGRYRFLQAEAPPLPSQLLGALSDPAFLLDRDGTIVGANVVAATRFGGGTLVGRKFETLVPNHPASAIRRSVHYDQFGDLVGSAVIVTGSQPPPPPELSPREVEVLELLVQGKTNQEIADALFVSEYTVKVHVHHILQKTGAENREDLFLRWGGNRL